MSDARAWFEAAQEHFEAAGFLLSRACWRSSSSRSYYAMFAATHSIAFHLDRQILPEGENGWKHRAIPNVLYTELRQGLDIPQHKAHLYQQYVRDAYTLRIIADYQPGTAIDRDQARDSYRGAAGVLQIAKGVLQ